MACSSWKSNLHAYGICLVQHAAISFRDKCGGEQCMLEVECTLIFAIIADDLQCWHQPL
jgi:hypothetical protein